MKVNIVDNKTKTKNKKENTKKSELNEIDLKIPFLKIDSTENSYFPSTFISNETFDITKGKLITHISTNDGWGFIYELFIKVFYQFINSYLISTSDGNKFLNKNDIGSFEGFESVLLTSITHSTFNIITPNNIKTFSFLDFITSLKNTNYENELFEIHEKNIYIPKYKNYKDLSNINFVQNVFIRFFNGKNLSDPIIPNFHNSLYLNNPNMIFNYLAHNFQNDDSFSDKYKKGYNYNIYLAFNSKSFSDNLEQTINTYNTSSVFNMIENKNKNALDNNFLINQGSINFIINDNYFQYPSVILNNVSNYRHIPDLNLYKEILNSFIDKVKYKYFHLNNIENRKVIEFNQYEYFEEDILKIQTKLKNYLDSNYSFSVYQFFSFIIETANYYSKVSTENNTQEEIKQIIDKYDVVKNYQKTISERSLGLSFIELDYDENDFGGFDLFKQKILSYKAIREKALIDSSVPLRGSSILLGGIPGAGKTMAAKYVGNVLKRNVFKFNLSKLIGSLQGVSEQNMDSELNLIRTSGEMVLLVDEIEKLFGGVQSSHATDGGVLLRLLEKFMAFLEEENPNIFIILTCNSITGLPPELLRSGRIQALMFADFPSNEELLDIMKIHAKIECPSMKLTNHDFENLTQMLKDRSEYNGSDIRELFRKTYEYSINENKDPSIEYFIRAFIMYQPNYEKLSEDFDKIRERFLDKFEPCSSKSYSFIQYKDNFTKKLHTITSKIKNKELKKILDQESNKIFDYKYLDNSINDELSSL